MVNLNRTQQTNEQWDKRVKEKAQETHINIETHMLAHIKNSIDV